MVYFDHNATTPMLPEARKAFLEAESDAWYNPGSPFRAGARVHALLETAREETAALTGTLPSRLVFTGGATESANSFFFWWRRRHGLHATILLSPLEHPAVWEPVVRWFPHTHQLWSVRQNGVVCLDHLERLLRERPPSLVCLMAANNETGVIQPVREVAALCREHGVPLFIDASQWFGKMPVLQPWDSQVYLMGCAHKFGGPKGTGFLILGDSGQDFVGLVGGGQEAGHRAGTENYPAIAAQLAALRWWSQWGERERSLRESWRCTWESRLLALDPNTFVIGHSSPRLWNTVLVKVSLAESDRWIRWLDKEGFAVSSGSACSTGSENPSRVLQSMGLGASDSRQVLRCSAGCMTTGEDWSALGDAFARIFRRLRSGEVKSSLVHLPVKST